MPPERDFLARLDRAMPFLLSGVVVVAAVLGVWWPLRGEGFRFARPFGSDP